MEDKVYSVVNADSLCPLVLTCEHASNHIPEKYQNLGLSAKDINRHIARDKGAKEVTLYLAQKLGCFAILAENSRLLIDLNRAKNEAELIVDESDKTLIPGNAKISDEEKKLRIEKYYNPYYGYLNQKLESLKQLGKKPVLFSVHSFTPQLRGGSFRPWNAGILFHKPQKLASFMFEKLQNTPAKKVGENVPYDLQKYNTGAAVFCGENQGNDYALIEIRDSEFENLTKGAEEWGNLLLPILQEYVK